jgi:hypothetical protein
VDAAEQALDGLPGWARSDEGSPIGFFNDVSSTDLVPEGVEAALALSLMLQLNE